MAFAPEEFRIEAPKCGYFCSMSASEFQNFISTDQQLVAFGTCLRTTSLLRLHQQFDSYGNETAAYVGHSGHLGFKVPPGSTQSRVAIVVDAESCLDRLYGGYYPDWSSGGEWRHMISYLVAVFSTLHQSNVHLAVFFNGALEPRRFKEWKEQQNVNRSRVEQIFRHLVKRGTPPPKAIWVPPCGLRTMLRLGLRSLNVTVLNSLEEHKHEVMSFCWENGYHGVMADDGEYALFNPPRYFSAHSFKLSLKYDFTATEFIMDEVAKSLDLNPNRFCLLATLLGNHILPIAELSEFHCRLAPEINQQQKYPVGFDRIIRAVINYIRALPSIEDFDMIGRDVFGSSNDPRVRLIRESMKYFIDGSQEGYAKLRRNYWPSKKKIKGKKGCALGGRNSSTRKSEIGDYVNLVSISEEESCQQSECADDKKASQKNSSKAGFVERIALDLGALDLNEAVKIATATHVGELIQRNSIDGEETTTPEVDGEVGGSDDDDTTGEGVDTSDKDSGEIDISVVQALASGMDVTASEGGKYPGKLAEDNALSSSSPETSIKHIHIPDILPEIERIASDRHRQGYMSPLVYQLLTRGELKFPVLLEDQRFGEIPPIHKIYQPLRQRVYAILFNLHHVRFNRRQAEETVKGYRRKAAELRKKAKNDVTNDDEKLELQAKADDLMKQSDCTIYPPEVNFCVREWLPYNNYEKPEAVEPLELNWGVPTVKKLWFGSAEEDKQKRLRSFLSCLCSDEIEVLLLQNKIPQRMLLPTCVLRYLMTASKSCPIIRKPELDAFLIAAFAPELWDQDYLDHLVLETVTPRGVQLATLFMQGIEMALLANDACGAPLPSHMCLPWTFFDGKLFHSTLLRASNARHILDLCGGRVHVACQVERLRATIMLGILPNVNRLLPSTRTGGLQQPAVRPRFCLPHHFGWRQQQQVLGGCMHHKSHNKGKVKKKNKNVKDRGNSEGQAQGHSSSTAPLEHCQSNGDAEAEESSKKAVVNTT